MITIGTELGSLWYRDYADDQIGVTHTMLATGAWAPPETEFVRERFDGGVFVDIGAHVGWFSVLAAQLGASKVYAIEPDPANAELLRLNTAAYPAVVEVLPVAAWDHAERLSLHSSASNTGDSRCYGQPDFPGASGETIEVAGVPLDDIVACADFVKVDTQGADFRVVAGMGRLLAESRPVVMLEFSPYHIRCIGEDPRETYGFYRSLTEYTVRTVPEGAPVNFDGYDDCTLALIPT